MHANKLGKLDQNKFLERFKLQKLTEEEIDYLNRTMQEVEELNQ